jgi:inner membrane transporter RhtA
LLVGAALALLMPEIPFSLELLALRRLKASTFGTLMSLEPAIAALIGFAVLAQSPGLSAVIGIALVVTAGIGVTVQDTASSQQLIGAGNEGAVVETEPTKA